MALSLQQTIETAIRDSDKVGGLRAELGKMELEPLLPVEKKLVAWSIGLGVMLLSVLFWVSHTFFPVGR